MLITETVVIIDSPAELDHYLNMVDHVLTCSFSDEELISAFKNF